MSAVLSCMLLSLAFAAPEDAVRDYNEGRVSFPTADPEAVFVGSGIFASDNPEKRARAIVSAVTHWQDAAIVAEASRGLGEAMRGLDVSKLAESELLQTRGW